MQFRRIFCVIDPTTREQRALKHALAAAGAANAALHVYTCFEPQPPKAVKSREDFLHTELDRYHAWLSLLTDEAKRDGVKVTIEVEAVVDWREAIAPAAARWNADLVVKANNPHSAIQRRMMKTADWTLLRSAHCPVVIIKSDQFTLPKNVIAAVDIAASDELHKALNEEVIQVARAIAETTGATLHAANAYSGSLNFVHPPDLAKLAGTIRANAHVGDKSAEALISEIVNGLEQPLVVIGSIARRGLQGAVVGNTAERILDTLSADVLTVMPSHDASVARTSPRKMSSAA